MPVVFGVSPGPKASLSLAALYYQDRWPASLILVSTVASLKEAIGKVVGVYGEWGTLSAVAVAAPLTWSGAPRAAREVDRQLRKRLPSWAPRTWQRPPLGLPAGVALQGAAFALALAGEIRHDQLPRHAVVECHPRLALARLWPDQREDILAYAHPKTSPVARGTHIDRLVSTFVTRGVLRLEHEPPREPHELDALVAAVTALGVAAPEAGVVVHELAGGELRPIGRRPVALLEALP